MVVDGVEVVVVVIESEVKDGSNADCCVVAGAGCVVAGAGCVVGADVDAGASCCVAAGDAVGTMDVACSGVLAPHPIFILNFLF